MTRTENIHVIHDVMEVFEAPLNDTEEYGACMEDPHAYSRGRQRMVVEEDRRQDHPILRACRARQRYARLLLADAEGRRRRIVTWEDSAYCPSTCANQSTCTLLAATPRRRGHREAVPAVDDDCMYDDDTDSEDNIWESRKMNSAAGVGANRRRPDRARDDEGSISNGRNRIWKDILHSSWRSLKEECIVSSL